MNIRFYIHICICAIVLVKPSAIMAQNSFSHFGEVKNNLSILDLKNVMSAYDIGDVTITKVALPESNTGQSFYLSVNKNKVNIKYTTQNSLDNAIYTYLGKLGFKWYGPNEHWFVKPKQITKIDIPGKWYSPDFRNRYFFGTGGLELDQPFDQENRYKIKWENWKRRNRFNSDFEGVGHRGRLFYIENKQLLDAHPEWFSSVEGKLNGRIKIENNSAVQAYKNWIYKKYLSLDGDFKAIGVDPEDGRGGIDDPLPPSGYAGIRTWNHADKWWWLANEVAKDYKEYKNTVITAYSYGDGYFNALAPSFKLVENVYPVIVPYSFQKAYLPEEMIKIWSTHVTGEMGVYDYWNITQGNLCLPHFDIYSIKPKLTFWKNNKVDGLYLETTDAAGPMGHALWLTGQIAWDRQLNFDTLYNQYLFDCFGKANEEIKKMFDRWSTNFQDAGDIALSLKNLQDASMLVKKNSDEWKRILDLKAYVHFMSLIYELDGSVQSRNNVFKYLYSIHHLTLVQTSAFISQEYINPIGPAPSGLGVDRLSADEIEKQFLTDLTKYTLKYSVVKSDFMLDKVSYTKPIKDNVWRWGSYNCHFYFRAPITGEFNFDVGAETTTRIKLYSTEGDKIFDVDVGKNKYDYKDTFKGYTWYMKKFKTNIQKGKMYHIVTSLGNNSVKIHSPEVVLLKKPGIGAQDFDNYDYPLQYFYVPKQATEIVFFDMNAEGTNGRGYLVTPDGERVKRTSIGLKNLYKVIVPPNYRGKLWIADFGHTAWGFKNIPNVTSLQEFKYLE